MDQFQTEIRVKMDNVKYIFTLAFREYIETIVSIHFKNDENISWKNKLENFILEKFPTKTGTFPEITTDEVNDINYFLQDCQFLIKIYLHVFPYISQLGIKPNKKLRDKLSHIKRERNYWAHTHNTTNNDLTSFSSDCKEVLQLIINDNSITAESNANFSFGIDFSEYQVAIDNVLKNDKILLTEYIKSLKDKNYYILLTEYIGLLKDKSVEKVLFTEYSKISNDENKIVLLAEYIKLLSENNNPKLLSEYIRMLGAENADKLLLKEYKKLSHDNKLFRYLKLLVHFPAGFAILITMFLLVGFLISEFIFDTQSNTIFLSYADPPLSFPVAHEEENVLVSPHHVNTQQCITEKQCDCVEPPPAVAGDDPADDQALKIIKYFVYKNTSDFVKELSRKLSTYFDADTEDGQISSLESMAQMRPTTLSSEAKKDATPQTPLDENKDPKP